MLGRVRQQTPKETDLRGDVPARGINRAGKRAGSRRAAGRTL